MKYLTALMLSAGLLSPETVMAAPIAAKATLKAAAPAKVMSIEGITEYRLANGLRVLMLPDASKPVITTNVVYNVGTRHENYGETGMAHLLEHLTFLRTAKYGSKAGDKTPTEILNAIGGKFNAATGFDRTNYFSTFPATDDNLAQVLALEAERMVNSTLAKDDLWNAATGKGEMSVVRNEFERNESNPVRVTMERVLALAYNWHNYGNAISGARTDIEQVNIERLKAFYGKYYQPDNAVLIVAGKFDEAKALEQVNRAFGAIARPARVLTPTYTREPVQDGERSVTIRRAGGMQLVLSGYHQPATSHPEALALSLFGRIVADAPSGRLHKALVETKKAAQVLHYSPELLEQGFGIFGAIVPKDGDIEAAQSAMLAVLENIKEQPITEEEVARAKLAVKAHNDRLMNDTHALAMAMAGFLAAGDWRLFQLQRDQTDKLDAATVQAAAVKYLKAANRNVARFVPTDAPDRAGEPAGYDLAAVLKDYKGRAAVAQVEAFDTAPAAIEARVERFALPNGMNAALLPKPTKGKQVNAVLRLRMGDVDSLRGKSVAGQYAAALLMHGTERLGRQELKDAFERLQAQVRVGGGADGVTASVTTTRENLPAVLDLLAEVLKRPAFPVASFQEVQGGHLTALQSQMTEPAPIAGNAFMQTIDPTPEGHVAHVYPMPQQLAMAKAVKLEDVKAFHAGFYHSRNASFSAVGDFDAAAVKTQLGKLFGDWNAPQSYARVAVAAKPAAAARMMLETPDKANSALFAGLPMKLRDDAADYPALVMANYMLGGGTLQGRLPNRIRKQEGLSYTVESTFVADQVDQSAIWFMYAISAPHNTAKVEAALKDELAKVLGAGFDAAELEQAKKAWMQGMATSRSSDAGIASRLAEYLGLQRTMAYDRDLEAGIASLTVEKVNAALRKHLDPSKLLMVGAGDFTKLGASSGGAK